MMQNLKIKLELKSVIFMAGIMKLFSYNLIIRKQNMLMQHFYGII